MLAVSIAAVVGLIVGGIGGIVVGAITVVNVLDGRY